MADPIREGLMLLAGSHNPMHGVIAGEGHWRIWMQQRFVREPGRDLKLVRVTYKTHPCCGKPYDIDQLGTPMSAKQFLGRLPAMDREEAAFIRGFAAATAMTIRHEVGNDELVRALGVDEAKLREAQVEGFDLDEILPVIRRLQKRKRGSRKA